MTPGERERAIHALDESRERLLATVQRLSPSQLAFKPAADRWSVAECVEHIIVVEQAVLGRITGALHQPTDATQHSAFEGNDEPLVERVTDRTQKAQAPEMIHPTGRWPHDRLLAEFRTARGRTSDFAATTDADLRRHLTAHPRLGPLDCYQWLLLIAAHGERHRAQAEEVMASAEFPRAVSAG
jgi:uncharacterized damage-inducible protein DinB